ncbi:N6-adenosine-methyltransferase non-catalytic subunit MTB-like isoform X1 [Macadamia integrifolia]|uniref:N6-adenosine-methyltransferase non-catalytic subunit MTB-like isoform X1 n=1 Tax=Macadamia integrifolia TaxID=60698 RepID=UPI001C52CD31|nr:N6-adenosine-methyltransferase non-catalytic subunit MTB-like isoform X1 [Macadamia integrifolia]
MDMPEPSRSYTKWDIEDNSEIKVDRAGDEEDWEGSDKRKHRLSKSRKHNNAEETDEWDSGGKRKSLGDRNESRKRSGGSSREGSGDEDDYDKRKEQRSKQIKKVQEDRTEKKSSSGYPDRESESSRKGRDASETKIHLLADESDRSSSRKTSSKPSVHEGSQGKSRSKVESPHDGKIEKMQDRDSRYSDRKENSREKSRGSRDQERNPRRRWDESDSTRKTDEGSYIDKSDSKSGKNSDLKLESTKDRAKDARDEFGERKSKVLDSNIDKVIKASGREEKRVDGERSKSRGRAETQDEDTGPSSTAREERLGNVRDDKQRRGGEKLVGLMEDVEFSAHRSSSRGHSEKIEKHRQQRDNAQSSREIAESRERSVNTDEDGHARAKDRSGREVRHSKRSCSPDRSGRRFLESDDSGSDNERSVSLKDKEREKDGYKDDRIKGRDGSWSGRNREWESSKDNWKKRHYSGSDKGTRDGDGDFNHDKEWDLQRHERERADNEMLLGRPGFRKDRSRTEGAKSSSSFGTPNENSDMIEIRTKSIDYGREESGSTFIGRRSDSGRYPDFTSATSDEDWGYPPDGRGRIADIYGPGDDPQERYPDDGSPMMDQNLGRFNIDMQGGRGRVQKSAMGINRSGSVQSSSSGSQPLFGNNQGSGSFSRVVAQGAKGSRFGRGVRGRLTGRDGQRVGMPLPMMGNPFGPLGLPPAPLQPLGPSMSPGPGTPIAPGVFIPPFPGPIVWPGPRGVDMNMLAVTAGLSPVPSGVSGPRFAPSMGTGPNPAMYFNQPGPARGVAPPSLSGPGFNAVGAMGRGVPHDKAPGNWVPPRSSGPPGKAPSRGEQNDYSQNFVDTGMRPQNFIRELELTSVVEDYPKLRELIQKKDEIVAKSASPPMYYKCDLREFVLSHEFFGTKFDVILIDPPWEEYVHRAPGVADHVEYWTFEEILNLKIEAIADTPSFIFLWVGDGVGLEQGRQCLKKWGFRRCEDICWVKTNKTNATPGLRHDSHTLFQHSKEHCLMGIKGTVRRSTDGHIIHANIDTDIIIAEEPPYGSTTKPEDLYRIIEHFALGRRRIELFGEDHNIRSGWLTVGKELSSSNFNAEAYVRNFADKDGKVWQGGGGRNPPPDTPHLVVTTPDIESLRPKSPPQKNQQQQPTSISQATANSTNKRPAGNSPQNSAALGLNQEASGSNPQTPAPWASPSGSMKGDAGNVAADDKYFDIYGYNALFGQTSGDHIEFESHRALNML